jgi:hypothetical protein
MWFEKLTGFVEINPDQVIENFDLIGYKITSKINHSELITKIPG